MHNSSTAHGGGVGGCRESLWLMLGVLEGFSLCVPTLFGVEFTGRGQYGGQNGIYQIYTRYIKF